jgi:hypothetical protein
MGPPRCGGGFFFVACVSGVALVFLSCMENMLKMHSLNMHGEHQNPLDAAFAAPPPAPPAPPATALKKRTLLTSRRVQSYAIAAVPLRVPSQAKAAVASQGPHTVHQHKVHKTTKGALSRSDDGIEVGGGGGGGGMVDITTTNSFKAPEGPEAALADGAGKASHGGAAKQSAGLVVDDGKAGQHIDRGDVFAERMAARDSHRQGVGDKIIGALEKANHSTGLSLSALANARAQERLSLTRRRLRWPARHGSHKQPDRKPTKKASKQAEPGKQRASTWQPMPGESQQSFKTRLLKIALDRQNRKQSQQPGGIGYKTNQ